MTENVYSQISTVLFSTVLVMVLLIIRDLQTFRLGGKHYAVESGQEMFDSIGKLRYYSKVVLDEGSMVVPSYIHEYRLGMHLPGEEIDLEVVKK